MARRINTRFVISLGAVLALVAGGAVIFVGRRYFLQKDPVYLTKMAEEAEKRGDMEIALHVYDQAVGRALETHAANAADLCMKVGDMAMKLSDQEKDRARAESLYLMARCSWEKALGDNPRYLPARQRLVKEDFQWAEGSAQAALWTSLAENVQKLIALSPNDATAYTYRAEARLQLLLTGAGGTGAMNDTIASIESDIKKAMQLDPKNPQPVILESQLLWSVKAPLVARPGDNTAALKVQDQGIAALQNFLKQAPNDPDASITLAIYMEQRRRGDEALKVVETAYAAHPDNARLANVLALLYQGTDPKKAEKVLQDAIAAAPNNTDEYRQLGDFYERTGKRGGDRDVQGVVAASETGRRDHVVFK